MDETRFYEILKLVLADYGQISRDIAFVNANSFLDAMASYPEIMNQIQQVLQFLHSTNDFARNGIPRFDFMLLGDSPFGNRMIEFDEEQHFTPFRYITIKAFENELTFRDRYLPLFDETDFQYGVIVKCRLTNIYVPETFFRPDELESVIEKCSHANPKNGYIKACRGFYYIGGRLAQRAFYDLMKDLYHFYDPDFKPTIRFSKFELELRYRTDFHHISDAQIDSYIKNVINRELLSK